MTQPPAATSGLDGFPARAALLFVWLTGLVHGVLVQAFAEGTALVLLAYALAACAAIAVTSPPRGRLPLAATAMVVACGLAIAAIVLTSPRVGTIVWLLDFASYPLALLIPRGRQLIGGAGIVVLLGAGTLWSLTTAQPEPSWGRMVSAPLVAGAVGFIWLNTLRRIVARETHARTDRERAEMLSRAARAATRTYQGELARVTAESEPVLRDIADSGQLDEGSLRRIGVIEGRIRDRLRAADLSHPRTTAAIDAARERGIRVLLIGSGRMAERGIGDGIADRIIAVLATPGLQTLTIRRLPPGRAAAVSIVGRTADGIVRGAFDERGYPVGDRPGTDAT